MLEGMIEESKAKYDDALRIYDAILKDDPSYVGAMKRKIGVEISKGKTGEAIQELIKYLDIYMLDIDAWKELADLYLANRMYSLGAYCLEEIILLQPHNHLNHLKYALILYTMGGYDNLLLSRHYYSLVLNLNPNNTRALIGLKLACNAIGNAKSLKTEERETNNKLNDFATQHLIDKYDSKMQKTHKSSQSSSLSKDATISAINSLNTRQK